MKLIDVNMVLKDIKDLQESPWHNRWSKSDSLCLQNQYVGRKEAVEIVRDLCIVKAKEVQAIPLDKIKQAREEIYNAHMEMLREHGWSNLLIALEILDKLIESEG